MTPLSIDLRQRIVAAYQNGEGSHATLAKRFSVSRAVVGKLVRQQRELGTLEPQLHRRGRKPAIGGEKKEQLQEHLCEHPDATLRERIEALDLHCSIKTMWQTIQRLGYRFKKNVAGGRTRSQGRRPETGRLATLPVRNRSRTARLRR